MVLATISSGVVWLRQNVFTLWRIKQAYEFHQRHLIASKLLRCLILLALATLCASIFNYYILPERNAYSLFLHQANTTTHPVINVKMNGSAAETVVVRYTNETGACVHFSYYPMCSTYSTPEACGAIWCDNENNRRVLAVRRLVAGQPQMSLWSRYYKPPEPHLEHIMSLEQCHESCKGADDSSLPSMAGLFMLFVFFGMVVCLLLFCGSCYTLSIDTNLWLIERANLKPVLKQHQQKQLATWKHKFEQLAAPGQPVRYFKAPNGLSFPITEKTGKAVLEIQRNRPLSHGLLDTLVKWLVYSWNTARDPNKPVQQQQQQHEDYLKFGDGTGGGGGDDELNSLAIQYSTGLYQPPPFPQPPPPPSPFYPYPFQQQSPQPPISSEQLQRRRRQQK